MTAMHAQGRRWALGLVPPLLFALALRWLGLRDQILTDDELHTVHGALTMPVGDIVRNWSFGGADYGVPQAAFFRVLMDRGVGLSELGFRIPSLLAGLAAVVVIPWLAVDRIGSRAATVLAWLLAIAPLLVLYSRIVRPYMPVALLATAAVLCFVRWWSTNSRRAAAGYIACAVAAVYFHLVAAPFVLAPLAYAAVDCCLHREDRRARVAGLLMLGSLTLLIIIASLLPARESLLQIMGQKRDGLMPGLATTLDVVRLQIGAGSATVAALAIAVGLRGVLVLWHRNRSFLFYIASLAGVQILALLLLSPDRIEETLVLGRYLLILLPLAMIPIAAGMIEPWLRANTQSARRFEAGCAAAGLAALFFAGPLASTTFLPDPFSHALSSMNFLEEEDSIPYEYVPRFYHELGSSPGRQVILEYPWQNVAGQTFDAYHHVHGGPVLVASVIDRSDEDRISLRNHVDPTPARFLESRANYVVVHLDLRSEASRLETSNIHHRQWLRAEPELWAPLRRAGRMMAGRLREVWGPPVYVDTSVQVWDLDAVRASRRGNG